MRDMKPTCVSVLAGVLSLLWPAALQANDSMAVLGAGGLQFEQTKDVQMEREDLYLSPREVRIDYVIRNVTDRDVGGRVAFPMPDVSPAALYFTPYGLPKSSRDGDMFAFTVQVDGLKVEPKVDARAFLLKRPGVDQEADVTDLLTKHRVPFLKMDFLLDLNADAAKALTDENVASEEKLSDGRVEYRANWGVRTVFHWDQVFPARKQVRITHIYKPVLGGSYHHAPGENLAAYCTDSAFVQVTRKLPAAKGSNGDSSLATRELEYILKTGANWAGPIQKFRHEIDKAGADLVSLCPIPGLKLERRGQNFVAEASQFTPAADLKLLFVFRACDKGPCVKENYPGLPDHAR